MRILSVFGAVTASAFLALQAHAQVFDTPADYAVIMDHETGTILYSKNGDVPMIPASMTKIMTAYLVFDRLERGEISLTDQFTVSEHAWRKGGFPSGTSTMGLKPKDRPTVEELLYGVIIMSGNDACIVLAEGMSGSEEAFAAEMTALAQDLGLTSAQFSDATGLSSENHVISAEDLAKLAKLTIDNYPQFFSIYAEESYEWREYKQANRNPLLGVMDGADGLKTGHLNISGYGLTASAVRDGKRRTVVLNGPSIDSKAKRGQVGEQLMRMAFTAFETRSIVPADVSLPEVPVWLGEAKTVPVKMTETISISAHKRAFEKAKTEIVLSGSLKAPVVAGDTIGQLVFTIDGRDPVSTPLVAAASVNKLGFLGMAVEGLSQKLAGASDKDDG